MKTAELQRGESAALKKGHQEVVTLSCHPGQRGFQSTCRFTVDLVLGRAPMCVADKRP